VRRRTTHFYLFYPHPKTVSAFDSVVNYEEKKKKKKKKEWGSDGGGFFESDKSP